MKSGAALIFSSMQQAHGDPAAQMTLREKLRHVSWSLVLLICLVASVGFAMLYSAAHGNFDPWADRQIARFRSEEHTSELQSLMRISYAVFCLKKKKHTHT